MHPTVVMLAVACLLRGYQSVQWTASSPTDGTTMYACSGDSVTLAWTYTLDAGDQLGKIQWYRQRGSEEPEMVAVLVGGNFFPTQAFRNFIGDVSNAGIVLSHVINTDSGNYSVMMHVYDVSGQHTSMTRSVYVQVGGQLKMPDGSVHASQSDQAVLDPSTDHFAFQLQCGHFMFHGDPPYMAQWTTPSGQNVTSSDYSDGHFNLLLNPPIQGGNYTCRVPQHLACLGSARQGEATVYVDKLDARLCVLEKANKRLEERLAQTTLELSHATAKLNQTRVDLSEGASEIKSTLIQTATDLRSRVQHLERVQDLENKKLPQQVGFHARFHIPESKNPLIFSTIYYNVNDAYDNTTGYFTAPLPGLYLFMASTMAQGEHETAHMNLVVDKLTIAHGYSYFDDDLLVTASTIHAVTHLTTGQRVWVRAGGTNIFSDYTLFSGALLSPDF